MNEPGSFFRLTSVGSAVEVTKSPAVREPAQAGESIGCLLPIS